MGLGKKGFLLTLLALILGTFFVLIFSSSFTNLPDYKVPLVDGRISMLNYYVENFFNYAKSVTVISGYAALQGTTKDMYATGNYIVNFTVEYPYCIMTGNLTTSKICPGMAGKTLSFFLQNLSASTEQELKLKSQFTINNVTVSDSENPFYVSVSVNLTLNISDIFANISTTRIFVAEIPIIGINDPIYFINSSGTYNQTFKRGNLTNKKWEGTWNTRDLEQMYLTREYVFSPSAPTFINRMRGNFSASNRSGIFGLYGIVNQSWADTVVTLQKRTRNQNISMVDYLFWNMTAFNCNLNNSIARINPATLPAIPNGGTTQFRLDADYATHFAVGGPNMTTACP